MSKPRCPKCNSSERYSLYSGGSEAAHCYHCGYIVERKGYESAGYSEIDYESVMNWTIIILGGINFLIALATHSVIAICVDVALVVAFVFIGW